MASRTVPILTALYAASLLNCAVARADPSNVTPAEHRYLAESRTYLDSPAPSDLVLLQLGHQTCEIRESGRTSDDAKAAIWNSWDEAHLPPADGAEIGSLVHTAVDALCPEVGYP